jgi:hypothetical protein
MPLRFGNPNSLELPEHRGSRTMSLSLARANR